MSSTNSPSAPQPDTPDSTSFHTTKVATIALVHFIHDIYTAFLAPLLPLLIERLGLSLTQAGSLSVFSQIPSFFNPFIGAIADRRNWIRLLVVVAPGVTATLMCFIGIAPNYAILALTLLAVGISVAAIHVSAPVMVARLSGDKVGRGTGMFMMGGELARTAGPIVAVWAVSHFGLDGLWKLIPPGVVASLVLWWRFEPPADHRDPRRQPSLKAMLVEMRIIITGIFGILVARSFMAAAATTYLPTYLYQEGNSLWFSGIALSVLELAGAVGVLVSGTLSDRLGRRLVLGFSIVLAPFLMLALLHVSGVPLLLVLLGLGFTTLATGPVLMATVLENAGVNQAAANGTFMAISFAVRALVILLVGFLSDQYGMRSAFMVCAGMAIIGLPFLWLIPKQDKNR